MKIADNKLLIGILLGLTMGIGMSFQIRNIREVESSDNTLAISTISTQTDCIEYKPDNLIYVPLDQYLRDIDRFDNEMVPHISERYQKLSTENTRMQGYAKKQPSRQCTFSLHRLKNFIAVVEAAAREHRQPLENLSITWSYAIYNASSEHIVNGSDFRSLQTLYGVPSMLTPTGEVQYIDVTRGFSDLGKTVGDRISQGQVANFVALSAEDDPIFNFGSMCPPACDDQDATVFAEADKNNSTFTTR